MAAAGLPQINFGFEELKERMARFTVRFDDFIEKGRARILQERNEFVKTIVEDKGSNPSPSFPCAVCVCFFFLSDGGVWE